MNSIEKAVNALIERIDIPHSMSMFITTSPHEYYSVATKLKEMFGDDSFSEKLERVSHNGAYINLRVVRQHDVDIDFCGREYDTLVVGDISNSGDIYKILNYTMSRLRNPQLFKDRPDLASRMIFT